MARALLRKAKVIVMDEASASVDSETDEVIQEAVRWQFRDCTVIIIAHRLHTIAYCDVVAVMEDGHVKEYDTPRNLLETKNSIFRMMCEQTGDLEGLLQLTSGSSQRHRSGSPGRTRSKRLQ
jgi:ATP-binding cassette subfamily C (CFTR/MRP) protein 1